MATLTLLWVMGAVASPSERGQVSFHSELVVGQVARETRRAKTERAARATAGNTVSNHG